MHSWVLMFCFHKYKLWGLLVDMAVVQVLQYASNLTYSMKTPVCGSKSRLSDKSVIVLLCWNFYTRNLVIFTILSNVFSRSGHFDVRVHISLLLGWLSLLVGDKWTVLFSALHHIPTASWLKNLRQPSIYLTKLCPAAWNHIKLSVPCWTGL